MNEKLLFESKGGNKIIEILYIICGVILIPAGLFGLFGVLFNKGGMSHSGYGGTWAYREAPGIESWLLVFGVLTVGALFIICVFASKKSYLRIYENHIEASSLDFKRILIGGNGSIISNIRLNYSEIQGVSIQTGRLVVDTYGEHKNIFCSDCNTEKKILIEQLNKCKS